MYSFRTGKVTFESLEEIPWTLDGEFGGNHDVVTVENLKKELQIMVPTEYVAQLTAEPEQFETEAETEE